MRRQACRRIEARRRELGLPNAAAYRAYRPRAGFARRDDLYCLLPSFRSAVALRRHDVRDDPPEGGFDLILCRNLAFTYFDEHLQRDTAVRLGRAVRGGGARVLGAHEELPEDAAAFEPWREIAHVYRRAATSTQREPSLHCGP